MVQASSIMVSPILQCRKYVHLDTVKYLTSHLLSSMDRKSRHGVIPQVANHDPLAHVDGTIADQRVGDTRFLDF